jgi:hypothetical protein
MLVSYILAIVALGTPLAASEVYYTEKSYAKSASRSATTCSTSSKTSVILSCEAMVPRFLRNY